MSESTEITTTQETAIAESRTRFDPNDLRSISSFDDALRLLEDSGVGLRDATTEIGDGFEMLEDKQLLLGRPLIVMAWVFAKGDFGEDYTIMRIVTDEGRKYVVTDGGTGICAQLKDYEERTGRTGGLGLKRGFRKSEYDNEFGHGVTFYLNV